MLKDTRLLILVGAANPAAHFAFPGKPRLLMPQDGEVHVLAAPSDDIEATLDALCDALDARRSQPVLLSAATSPGPLPTGKPTAEHIPHVIAALLPENAIVVEEAITSGRQLLKPTALAAPHDWLDVTGGAIGFSLPAAVGAAIACPDRKVLAIVGDGSAMYTIQALWTMARERLDVTVVVCANRAYQVLRGELQNMGGPPPGPKAGRMLTLDDPTLDWVALAKGHGVEARSVATLEAFADALRRAMQVKGPQLIELLM